MDGIFVQKNIMMTSVTDLCFHCPLVNQSPDRKFDLNGHLESIES